MIPQISCSEVMCENFPFAIRRELHDAGHAPSWHSHEFIEMVYVRAGEGHHLVQDARHHLVPGDIFFIRPGEAHAFDFPNRTAVSIVNCLFLPSFLPMSLGKPVVPTDALDYLYVHPYLGSEERFRGVVNLTGVSCEYVRALLDQMLDEWAGGTGVGTGLLRIQMLELLILLSREYGMREDFISRTSPSPAHDMVQRLLGFIAVHLEEKLSVESLAAHFHVSRRHLERLVHQETGATIVDHMHSIRIAQARRLLEDSNDPVAQIAEHVGYQDPAFFSRLFSRHMGKSPSQYRRERRLPSTEAQGFLSKV